MQQWVNIVSSAICSIFSALFSGLTIGFMSLDLFQLHLLAHVDPQTTEDKLNQKRAKKVLPLRRDANHLLVTLITCNSMINAALVLFIGDIFDFTLGFVISSIVITIFGEIAPQAIFFKNQLSLCAFFSFFTRCVLIILYPITKPLSLLLTFLIGLCIYSTDNSLNISLVISIGTTSQIVYNRQQLKALVDLQRDFGGVLSADEAKILKGCLNLSLVSAETIMTPLEDVYSITVDTIINSAVINEISHTGYSKIPIVDKTQSQSVLGFLLVKDLLLIDTSSNHRISDLLNTIGKPTYAVDASCGIMTVLSHFKNDSTRIAVVRSVVVDKNHGDPTYSHIGIITMDDILQLILNEEMKSYNERGIMLRSSSIKRITHRRGLHKMLNSVKDPRSFTLNAIINIYPIQEPESILKLLGLSTSKENIDKLQRHRIYLVKRQVVIPNHALTIVLKGSVTNLYSGNNSYKMLQDNPFIINDHSNYMGSCIDVFITASDCELIQLDPNEAFVLDS